MPDSCTRLYIHFVWGTHNRLPLLTPDVEEGVYRCISAGCAKLQCQPIAIGGLEDHVHVLVRLRSTVSVATLAQEMKGASSHLVTHKLAPEKPFRWQNGYGAFSVTSGDVDRVKEYVQQQKERHAQGRVWEGWELPAEPGQWPDHDSGLNSHPSSSI